MGLPDVYGEDTETAQQVQAMLDIMPEGTRSSLDMHLRQAAKKELSKEAKEALADQAQNVSQRLTGMREQLVKQEQTCETPVTIEFYHCDHLGTPIALTNEQHQVVWAARLDPWGNVQEEFNPSGMDQAIRLPGQHHDRETGLYYNRHRYYDPGIGSYVNQDPIGLAGGVNTFMYPVNPIGWIDPLGLDPSQVPKHGPDLGKIKGWFDKAKDALDWRENYDKGIEVKKNQNKLVCEAEKGFEDQVKNNQITPEAAKSALAAKKFSIYAAGPFSTAAEGLSTESWITNVPVAAGYYAAPAKDCVKLIGTSPPTFDFFKR